MPNFYAHESGFWIFIQLTPDEPVASFSHSEDTDEGWSSYDCTYTWDADEGTVVRETHTDGRDCDGRMQTHHVDVCAVEQLASVEALGFGGELLPFLVPRWVKQSSGQRDYSAEAMGY